MESVQFRKSGFHRLPALLCMLAGECSFSPLHACWGVQLLRYLTYWSLPQVKKYSMFYAAIFQILSHLLSCVHRLYTMDGHLLDNSKDLQDNSFYVAAGLETFKYIPYWKSPRVPSEVQQ